MRQLLVALTLGAIVLPLAVRAQEGRGSNPLGAVGALGGGGRRAPDRSNEPAPRLPDGTVSLNGLWVGGGPVDDISVGLPKGEKLPLTAAATKLMEYRAQHESDDPHLWCMPMGVPRSTPYPFKFVQDITGGSAAAHLYILHEGNIHSYRQIFMDGRQHPGPRHPSRRSNNRLQSGTPPSSRSTGSAWS